MNGVKLSVETEPSVSLSLSRDPSVANRSKCLVRFEAEIEINNLKFNCFPEESLKVVVLSFGGVRSSPTNTCTVVMYVQYNTPH